MYFSTSFQKLGFRFLQFSQWNYIKTYNFLYSLDSEKSIVYYSILFCPGKKFPGHTRPQNFGQKIRKKWKMTIFKANPRLVKNSYCPKLILIYNISTFICKKMSKSWPLMPFASLKYCAEKGFSKLTLRFLWK